ncbi:DUF6415 family natural product biosynthesis protein [Streptomyces sp. NPDC001663]|uniref:DUF6415 family natural product biosynthesis protein n=1 Tax=Streptomyces sp. NPDC001663 TaxID=3364597 RepID=UPI003689BD1D
MISGVGDLTWVTGMRLTPAGVEWDAVRVGRYLGVQAIGRIARPGAVAVDPACAEPFLYFLLPAGSTDGWEVPHTRPLGANAYVVLPPADKDSPPGPYWLIPPKCGFTRAATLRRALEEAVAVASSPAQMLAVARRLIDDDAELADRQTVLSLARDLRGYLMVLIREIEYRCRQPGVETAVREAALAGVGEAEQRLGQAAGRTSTSEVTYARGLARSVDALLDHRAKLEAL